MLFNIGDNEVTAGELKSRGYYQGSNVSYNLKKLFEMGYMHHQRCAIDRRSVRVRLTSEGRKIHRTVAELFERHAAGLQKAGVLGANGIDEITGPLKRVERYWTDQIRYIYLRVCLTRFSLLWGWICNGLGAGLIAPITKVSSSLSNFCDMAAA